jgi:hypothetical protein
MRAGPVQANQENVITTFSKIQNHGIVFQKSQPKNTPPDVIKRRWGTSPPELNLKYIVNYKLEVVKIMDALT